MRSPAAPPPAPAAAAPVPAIPSQEGNVQLDSKQIAQAKKLCNFAASALDYDDVTTAKNNLMRRSRYSIPDNAEEDILIKYVYFVRQYSFYRDLCPSVRTNWANYNKIENSHAPFQVVMGIMAR